MTRLAQELIRTMTAGEQRAVADYERNVTRIRHGYTGSRRGRLWAGELRRLEGAAAGSPSFDTFCDRALKRLTKFEAELAEAAR